MREEIETINHAIHEMYKLQDLLEGKRKESARVDTIIKKLVNLHYDLLAQEESK